MGKKKLIAENLCKAEVVRISWKRIFLALDVQVEYPDNQWPDTPLVFYAVNQDGKAGARFKQTFVENGRYHLELNITNQGENRCVEQGVYALALCQGGHVLTLCQTSPELCPHLEEDSRNFLYKNRKSVYTVSFFVEEDADTELPFRMYFMASDKTDMNWDNRPLQQGIKSPAGMLRASKRPFLRRLYSWYRKLYHRKSSGKTVLFLSEQSERLGGNQTAVLKRMKERGMEGEWTLLTSARPAAARPQSESSWIKLIKKLAKSDIVVVDDHAPVLDWLVLDDKTRVIQLWHAGAGFKSSGYSRWGHPGCPSPYCAHRQYDFGIAGSRQIAPFFSEVWGINDEQVLPTGMPRMDEYLDADHRTQIEKELYEKYPICRDKKVILFAPTYRGKNKKTAYYPYELIDFQELYKVCGNEYVVLFKMHPWIASRVPINSMYEDRMLDVGDYPNINDLFYITDLLITDYSSNIFEYSLMNKPALFFAYDRIQYGFSRGFHRDYEESAPGKVCETFDELMNAIRQRDFQMDKIKAYAEHHFDYIDSHASDRVIDWLILNNIPEEFQKELAAVDAANREMKTMVFPYEEAE